MPELEALSLQLGKVDDPGTWIDGLRQLANLLIQQMGTSEDEAPSPFEIQKSGLLNALQAFLSDPTERRLRFFLLLRVCLCEIIYLKTTIKAINAVIFVVNFRSLWAHATRRTLI